MLQPKTDLTVRGGSVIKSNPTWGNDYNSYNPVIKLNGAKDITVNLESCDITAYNSLYVGYSDKGTLHENAVFNIYDGANIKSGMNTYESGTTALDGKTKAAADNSILFSAEWKGIELNMYGGTLTAASTATALHFASATGKGSVANIYGGTVNGYINVNASYTTVNLFGGTFVRNAKDTYTNFTDVVHEEANLYGGTIKNYAGTYDLSTGFEYDTAVSVRTSNDTTGLRFTSTLSADFIARMDALVGADNYEIGTIIVPYTYLEKGMDLPVLTHEALDSHYLPYLDIEANNSRVKNADGSYTIKAAITNIKAHNLETEFIATSYVSFETEDGKKYTVYSNAAPSADDARSAEYVAVMALRDYKITSDGDKYVNAVHTIATFTGTGATVNYTVTNDTNNTWYSKYTDQECKNIAALVPALTGECDAPKN